MFKSKWKDVNRWIQKQHRKNKVLPNDTKTWVGKSSAEPPGQPGMHAKIRYILAVAAALGTFPVSNITSSSTQALRFRWFCLVTFYSLLLLFGLLTVEVISIDYTIQHLNQANLTVAGGFKRATSGTIFYGNACAGAYLFFYLAKSWPDLARRWRTVELSMKRYGQPNLLCRFLTIATVFMSLAFLENGLHNWLSVQSIAQSNKSNNETITFVDYVKIFATNSHWYLFANYPYTLWKGFATIWLSLSGTFIWNFIDLFIMLISSALAAQFHVLTKALRAVRGKVLTQLQWREFREMYASLTHLVKLVDHHVNKIIVLSVANNVYFICAQLITEIDSGSSAEKDYRSQVFYMYSTLFLVGRTTAVVLYAATIHDESRLVAPELFHCPPQGYCTERTAHQLKKLWDNLKSRRKSEMAQMKRASFKTGGGPPPEHPYAKDDPTDGFLDMIVSDIEGVIDSDATFCEPNQVNEGEELELSNLIHLEDSDILPSSPDPIQDPSTPHPCPNPPQPLHTASPLHTTNLRPKPLKNACGFARSKQNLALQSEVDARVLRVKNQMKYDEALHSLLIKEIANKIQISELQKKEAEVSLKIKEAELEHKTKMWELELLAKQKDLGTK